MFPRYRKPCQAEGDDHRDQEPRPQRELEPSATRLHFCVRCIRRGKDPRHTEHPPSQPHKEQYSGAEPTNEENRKDYHVARLQESLEVPAKAPHRHECPGRRQNHAYQRRATKPKTFMVAPHGYVDDVG